RAERFDKGIPKDFTDEQRREAIRGHKYHYEYVEKLYRTDRVFQALHVTVARLFAEQLKVDLATLKEMTEEEKNDRKTVAKRISLAAKWAPSLEKRHDQDTRIASSIAELMFSSEHPESKFKDREQAVHEWRVLY